MICCFEIYFFRFNKTSSELVKLNFRECDETFADIFLKFWDEGSETSGERKDASSPGALPAARIRFRPISSVQS